MEELRKQLIEAIANRDTEKLVQLKEQLAFNKFLSRYTDKNGMVNVPVSAWITDLPNIITFK